MKQHKDKKEQQNSTEWNPSVSNMNVITLKVLRLINELVNYDGKWQEKNKETKGY